MRKKRSFVSEEKSIAYSFVGIFGRMRRIDGISRFYRLIELRI